LSSTVPHEWQYLELERSGLNLTPRGNLGVTGDNGVVGFVIVGFVFTIILLVVDVVVVVVVSETETETDDVSCKSRYSNPALSALSHTSRQAFVGTVQSRCVPLSVTARKATGSSETGETPTKL